MVFHLNDMVETLGRKIIVGDVMELPHLKDYYPLDEDLPTALKRYYVVQDATRAAEGFAPTWYPHLWRVKIAPLVDSQEYKDILNVIKAGDDTDTTIGQLLSTYDKYIEINDAIVQRAEAEVPESGYDTSTFYTEPVLDDGRPGDPAGSPQEKVQGYLTGDGIPPNGAAVAAGISFPSNAQAGDFFLRLDYMPNRLFRHDGRRWVKVEDDVRTNLTPGADNKTQRSDFVNNNNVRYSDELWYDAIQVASSYTHQANSKTISFSMSTGTVVTNIPYVRTYGVKTQLNHMTIVNTMSNSSGNISFTVSQTLTPGDLLEYTVYAKKHVERQGLSQALRPEADN
jgi:hypothetical protein